MIGFYKLIFYFYTLILSFKESNPLLVNRQGLTKTQNRKDPLPNDKEAFKN